MRPSESRNSEQQKKEATTYRDSDQLLRCDFSKPSLAVDWCLLRYLLIRALLSPNNCSSDCSALPLEVPLTKSCQKKGLLDAASGSRRDARGSLLIESRWWVLPLDLLLEWRCLLEEFDCFSLLIGKSSCSKPDEDQRNTIKKISCYSKN